MFVIRVFKVMVSNVFLSRVIYVLISTVMYWLSVRLVMMETSFAVVLRVLKVMVIIVNLRKIRAKVMLSQCAWLRDVRRGKFVTRSQSVLYLCVCVMKRLGILFVMGIVVVVFVCSIQSAVASSCVFSIVRVVMSRILVVAFSVNAWY